MGVAAQKVNQNLPNSGKKLGEAGEQLKLKGYGNDSSSGNLIKVALVFPEFGRIW